MVLELLSPYVPVLVVVVAWIVSLRPVLRAIHARAPARATPRVRANHGS